MIDPTAPDGWRFEVRTGSLAKADEERLKRGTKTARGTHFSCVLTGVAISPDYVRSEGLAGLLSARLMAIVAQGVRGRVYLAPMQEHEARAADARPGDTSGIEAEMPENPRWFSPPGYGMKRYVDLFTPRQLAALTTFSDLVGEARERVLVDACAAAGLSDDSTSLHEGGAGTKAYADAVATYLAFGVDRLADRASTVCSWDTGAEGRSSTGSPGRSAAIRGTFSRQAIPMTWDYAEGNVFSESASNFGDAIGWVLKPFDHSRIPASGFGEACHLDAAKNSYPTRPLVISTDPPYYDNIGYADLSDYFYVWLKRSLAGIWPDLFRRLTTPKQEELVATPYRHGGREKAEAFFMRGMSQALTAMREAATDGEPLAIYYAFKQSELAEEGIVSAGWASFLQSVVDAGLAVDGTWPVRTELPSRLIANNANALASSIVLVCRKRPVTAQTITRAAFLRELKREMPEAVEKIRKASVGPVDMQQSVIGPGMGVFTRYASVLEDDDSQMAVKTALALINRVWGEIENDLEANFDPETQVALAWFATYGFEVRTSGELITLTTAKNTPERTLFDSGVFQDMKGRVKLRDRPEWTNDASPSDPEEEKRFKRDIDERWPKTVWGCVQHTARVLRSEDGGAEPAAKLIAMMGAKAEDARLLAHRLYQIAHDKGWAAEALVYNELAQDWTNLEDRAMQFRDAPPMTDLFGAIAR